MELIQTFLVATVSIILLMTIAWIISQVVGKLSIVDIVWGLGFIVVALSTLIFNAQYQPRQILVTLLVCLWGGRLAFYIYLRNKGKPEDFRYQKMKENWGKDEAIHSYLKVFLLQGFFMFLVTFVVQIINTFAYQPAIGIVDIIGAAVWIFGFLFESIGDYQMYMFKKDPKNKGKIMTSGLWKYTRHPNYFGEATQWWGIFIISLRAPFGIIGIISPIVITYMLRKVSGVPMLEAKYKENKEYQNYIKNTSGFIPKSPKSL
ncbi:MAG: DUF1295 domain-containing protein [Candidatus Dojkabacteria bacterium]